MRVRRQMHLAVYFPHDNGITAPIDQSSRPQREFSAFERLARTAERGLFDFLFVAEGPEPIALLNALAAVTDHLGLVATLDVVSHAPYELARRLATSDHLSGGRAAWNIVTSRDADTDGYRHAVEFVQVARQLWNSWSVDGVPRPFVHQGRHFDIAGEFTVPRSPQRHPVLIQAEDSGEGREFAAATADVILTQHGTLEAGRSFYADVKRRLAAYGRTPEDLRIMPGVTVVLGDTAAEAQQRAAEIRRRQVSPQNATFIGTPEAVATELEEFVRRDAADGFVLVPYPTPGGLDEFVDRVVPLLQERGVFRTGYQGTTLRSHLGLSDPVEGAEPMTRGAFA